MLYTFYFIGDGRLETIHIRQNTSSIILALKNRLCLQWKSKTKAIVALRDVWNSYFFDYVLTHLVRNCIPYQFLVAQDWLARGWSILVLVRLLVLHDYYVRILDSFIDFLLTLTFFTFWSVTLLKDNHKRVGLGGRKLTENFKLFIDAHKQLIFK